MNASWTRLEPDVRAFIDEFDARGTDPQGEAEKLFASTFLAVDAQLAVGVTPDQFAAALPARRAMFRAAGVSAVVRQRAEQLRLDERHVLVRGQWSAERDAGPITLSSTLLLRNEPPGYRILVYLNHHDVAALLAAR